MKILKTVLTVLIAVLLTVVLFCGSILFGLKNQLSVEGVRDMAENFDLYKTVSLLLNKDGNTLEKWLEEQSDENLLTRIVYSENGLRRISSLNTLKSAILNKIEDYVDDFYNDSGRGKIRTEEFSALFSELTGDFEKYLDYKFDIKDIDDLKEDLDARELEQYDFQNLKKDIKGLDIIRFVLSDGGIFAVLGVALLLTVLIILINRNRSVFSAVGIPLIISGALLLTAPLAIRLSSILTANQFVNACEIISQTFNIFLSCIMWCGIAEMVLGIVMCTVGGIIGRIRKTA